MSTSNIPPGHQTPQVQPQSEQARQNKQPKISGQEPNSTGQSGTIASKDKTARTEDFAQQQIRQEQKEDQKEREERQRQDLEGKIVVLNFWATWCAPCLRLIPDAKDLYESHSRRDLLLLGVNLDTGGNRALRRWLKLNRHNVTWPQLFNRRGFNGALPRAYEIKDVPAILIFDRQGNLTYRCNSAPCTREAVRRLMDKNQ